MSGLLSLKKRMRNHKRERKRENAAAEAAEAEAARFIIPLARIAYSLIYSSSYLVDKNVAQKS
jgi:hypothetical protein